MSEKTLNFNFTELYLVHIFINEIIGRINFTAKNLHSAIREIKLIELKSKVGVFKYHDDPLNNELTYLKNGVGELIELRFQVQSIVNYLKQKPSEERKKYDKINCPTSESLEEIISRANKILTDYKF
jgi:hypothetical protein